MKKIFIFFFVLFFLPQETYAFFNDLTFIFRASGNIYSFSVPVIKSLKDQKRGSYFPGIFDSKILKFSHLSSKTIEQIKKQQEEERKKIRERQLRLGIVEPVFDGRYIDIDLSSQTLTVFENRSAVYRYKISTGKRDMPTPIGTFSIRNKIRRAYSRRYDLYMPWWLGFTSSGHGIHELPEWRNGVKEGAGHLGIPVSHGCVRLGVGAAKNVYDWANIGDIVYIHK